MLFTGKSAGSAAGRAATDSRTGVKADPVIILTLPGSPALCLPRLNGGQGASLSTQVILYPTFFPFLIPRASIRQKPGRNVASSSKSLPAGWNPIGKPPSEEKSEKKF